jgi:ATP-binding cassette, subfamily B, bacterial MsbA
MDDPRQSLDGEPQSQRSSPAPIQARKTLRQRLSRLRPYLHGSLPGATLLVAASLVLAATEAAIPGLFKAFMDRGFGANRGYELWMVPVLVIGLFAVRGLAVFGSAYSLSWITQGALMKLRVALFDRVSRSAPDLFTRRSASALTQTVIHESNQGIGLLGGVALSVVRDGLTVLALIAWLLWLNWQLTLAVLVIAPAVGFVMRLVSKRLTRLAKQAREASEQLAYVVEENALAWRLTRLHDAGHAQRERFERISRWLRNVMLKSTAAGALSSPVTQLIASVAVSGVMVVALWQGSRGDMSMGDFMAFLTAMLLLLSPLKHLADINAPLMRGIVSAEHCIDLIDHQPVESGGDVVVERALGAITFENVSLRYKTEAALSLEDVSLHVHPGRVLAIVGPSGGGKSTLVNLLPRFVTPQQGRVLLDGIALERWNLASLRRQFALVSQDVIFFNDTIAANVALGAPMDEARVRQALADANLLDDVKRLPEGLHTALGHNATQFSGGQRQRLAIARAIYKDAPILILDEATSALDSQSERAVQTALERLMQGRTTLVIAHRLATVEHAHEVIVMDRGRIVEQGAPAELKARGGLYAQLAAMQFRAG